MRSWVPFVAALAALSPATASPTSMDQWDVLAGKALGNQILCAHQPDDVHPFNSISQSHYKPIEEYPTEPITNRATS
ncbi:unnamed protein product [Aspergillus oryzae]|nr:unnamed protein product [Aspergillus oryzae]